MQFKSYFIPRANAVLHFRSMLRYAVTTQIAKVRISANRGASWDVLWSQDGDDGSGEQDYGSEAASLAAYEGEEILIQFLYDFNDGGYAHSIDSVG